MGLDPGALRMGYALVSGNLDTGFSYIDSGSDGLVRPVDDKGKQQQFQIYRKDLIDYWAKEFGNCLAFLLEQGHEIDVTFEMLPGQGGQNFSAGSTQSELAKTAAAACQTMCRWFDVPWQVVSALTVKKDVAGVGSASKVAVRNAVLSVFPELEPRKKELTGQGADESDAVAIALWGAGYRLPKSTTKRRAKQDI